MTASLFVLLADPHQPTEAITSPHAEAEKVGQRYCNIAAFYKLTAEQLTP